jgi:tetratricopeptide (TPR) repeat protein
VRKELSSFWSDLEIAVYAPAQFRSMDRKKVLEDAERLLKSLDRSLSKTPSILGKMAVLGFVLVCVAGSVLAETDAEKKFAGSNRAFQEGRFEEARAGYAELEKESSSFVLEYDLGNACYQSGRTGEAILHWVRAWRMDPRDSDVRHNLALVSVQAGAPFFPGHPLMKILHSLFYALNFNELSMLFLIFFWLAGIIWIRSILKNEFSVRPFSLIVTAVFVVSLLWWGSRFVLERSRSLAVVTAQKAEVRSGPGARFSVGFTVPEGQRVLVLETPSDSAWEEIGVPEKGLRGWVESGTIQKI